MDTSSDTSKQSHHLHSTETILYPLYHHKCTKYHPHESASLLGSPFEAFHCLEALFLFVPAVLNHAQLGIITVIRRPFHKGLGSFSRGIRDLLHRNSVRGARIRHRWLRRNHGPRDRSLQVRNGHHLHSLLRVISIRNLPGSAHTIDISGHLLLFHVFGPRELAVPHDLPHIILAGADHTGFPHTCGGWRHRIISFGFSHREFESAGLNGSLSKGCSE